MNPHVLKALLLSASPEAVPNPEGASHGKRCETMETRQELQRLHSTLWQDSETHTVPAPTWNMEMFRGLSVSWSERATVRPIGDRGVPTAGRLIASNERMEKTKWEEGEQLKKKKKSKPNQTQTKLVESKSPGRKEVEPKYKYKQ